MKIAIYGQFYHPNAAMYTEELLNILDQENIEVVLEKGFLELIGEHGAIKRKFTHFKTFEDFEDLDSSFNFFFSVGGDGTILKSITYIQNLNIPIVGINTGRLGFLATVNKTEIKNSIQKLLKKEFTIIEKTLLALYTHSDETAIGPQNFALNEIAVTRKNTTSMITIETWLNGEHLTAYWADGLIIATPTGSTGYSLSCGGPVITPATRAFVITPIAPHNLNARPLILRDKTEITLKISAREDSFLVSLDSRITTLNTQTTLTIKKAPFTVKMVEFEGDSFLQTLRKKMLWGEDKRN